MSDQTTHLRLGLRFANQLRDPVFRGVLRQFGSARHRIVPVTADTSLGEALQRVDLNSTLSPFLIVIEDQTQPFGWRYLICDLPAVIAGEEEPVSEPASPL